MLPELYNHIVLFHARHHRRRIVCDAADENAFWNAGFIGKFFCDILSADADIRAAHVVGKIFDQLFDLGNRNARHHVVSLGTVTLRNNADDFAVKIYQNAAAVRAAEDVGGQQIVLIVQRGNLVRNRSHHTIRNRIAVADRASDSHDRVTLADEIRTAERRNRKTVPCFLIQLRFIHLHNRKAGARIVALVCGIHHRLVPEGDLNPLHIFHDAVFRQNKEILPVVRNNQTGNLLLVFIVLVKIVHLIGNADDGNQRSFWFFRYFQHILVERFIIFQAAVLFLRIRFPIDTGNLAALLRLFGSAAFRSLCRSILLCAFGNRTFGYTAF